MEINYSKQALKFLKKQDSRTRHRLIRAIESLPDDGDRKKLTNQDGYRLRVGDFRIIYDIFGNVVEIFKIGNRGDIYN